jgi:hypothetical protein
VIAEHFHRGRRLLSFSQDDLMPYCFDPLHDIGATSWISKDAEGDIDIGLAGGNGW